MQNIEQPLKRNEKKEKQLGEQPQISNIRNIPKTKVYKSEK